MSKTEKAKAALAAMKNDEAAESALRALRAASAAAFIPARDARDEALETALMAVPAAAELALKGAKTATNAAYHLRRRGQAVSELDAAEEAAVKAALVDPRVVHENKAAADYAAASKARAEAMAAAETAVAEAIAEEWAPYGGAPMVQFGGHWTVNPNDPLGLAVANYAEAGSYQFGGTPDEWVASGRELPAMVVAPEPVVVAPVVEPAAATVSAPAQEPAKAPVVEPKSTTPNLKLVITGFGCYHEKRLAGALKSALGCHRLLGHYGQHLANVEAMAEMVMDAFPGIETGDTDPTTSRLRELVEFAAGLLPE